MKEYLKAYKARIHVMSPTFVGSGKEINKKEYRLSGEEQKVVIYDPGKFYQLMQKAGKASRYEDYLLRGNSNLEMWMQDNRVGNSDVADAVRYSVSWGDRLQLGNSRTQIMEFCKDPYGKPYVPGTSIKGMLRTILLGYEISKNSNRYGEPSTQIRSFKTERPSNKAYQNSTKEVESIAFNTLGRDEKSKKNAVNDILQGLIISDSKPIELDRLVLCQKIEYHINGEEKPLNLLRECLCPGTDIEFAVTIDSSSCPYDANTIMAAIKKFNEMYYNCFLSKFGLKENPDDTVYLGGGVGFVSKTFIYPMFGAVEGVKVTQKVFENTLKTRIFTEHGHKKDIMNGVSPHILKYTKYKKGKHQMGMCRFVIEEM